MVKFELPPVEAKDVKIRRRVLVGTISNSAGQLVTFGVGFVITPILLSWLGQSDYGLWLLVGSLVAYGNLFDFGIAGAVTKYVAEYQVRGEVGEARSLIATSLWMYTILGAAVITLAALLAPLFPEIFNVAPEDRTLSIQLVRVMGLGLGLSIPTATTYAILRGLQRFDYANIISIMGTVLAAIAMVAALALGGGLVWMVGVNIPVALSMQVPAVWLIHRASPGLSISWRGAERSLVRKVLSYSSSIVAIQAAGQLRYRTDEMVVGAYLPVSFVTPYGLARRLSEPARLLTYQFTKTILPLASQLEAEQDVERLRAVYLTGLRLSLAAFSVIGAATAILAGPLLNFWVGKEYTGYAYLVWVLVAAGLVFIAQGPASMILQGIARHRLLAAVSLGSGLANLGLSVLLVRPFGLLGVALGTLIPNIVESFLILVPYSLRVLGIRWKRLWREAVKPAFLPALPMVALMVGLAYLVKPVSLIAILAVAGAGALVYLLVYLAVGATVAERQVTLDVLDQLLHWREPRLSDPKGEIK